MGCFHMERVSPQIHTPGNDMAGFDPINPSGNDEWGLIQRFIYVWSFSSVWIRKEYLTSLVDGRSSVGTCSIYTSWSGQLGFIQVNQGGRSVYWVRESHTLQVVIMRMWYTKSWMVLMMLNSFVKSLGGFDLTSWLFWRICTSDIGVHTPYWQQTTQGDKTGAQETDIGGCEACDTGTWLGTYKCRHKSDACFLWRAVECLDFWRNVSATDMYILLTANNSRRHCRVWKIWQELLDCLWTVTCLMLAFEENYGLSDSFRRSSGSDIGVL